MLWVESQVVSAIVHVVGSNNGLALWFGAAETPEQRARPLAQYSARVAAALACMDRAFDLAEEHDLGVVLAMQADMWDASGQLSGFTPIVQGVAERTRAFDGEVLLLQGDSHRFLVDNPLADGDPRLRRALRRSQPDPDRRGGETASEWLRLTIDPRAEQLFAWERVPV